VELEQTQNGRFDKLEQPKTAACALSLFS